MEAQKIVSKEEIGKPLPYEVGCLDESGLNGYIMQKDERNMLFIVMDEDTSEKRWRNLEKSKIEFGLLAEGGSIMLMIVFRGIFKTNAIFAYEFDSRKLQLTSSFEIVVDDLSPEHVQFRRNFFLRVVDHEGKLRMVRNLTLSTEFTQSLLEAIKVQSNSVLTMHNLNKWQKLSPKEVLRVAKIDRPYVSTTPFSFIDG